MNTTDFFNIHEAMDPEAKVGAFTSTIISIIAQKNQECKETILPAWGGGTAMLQAKTMV